MSTAATTSSRTLALLLAAALAALAGCASGTGGTDGEAPDAEARAAASTGPTCRQDCRLRVENRADTDVGLHADRSRSSPALGIVRENQIEVITLTNFTGSQLEVWVRDAEAGMTLVGVHCVRSFPDGTGRLIVEEGRRGGSC